MFWILNKSSFKVVVQHQYSFIVENNNKQYFHIVDVTTFLNSH